MKKNFFLRLLCLSLAVCLSGCAAPQIYPGAKPANNFGAESEYNSYAMEYPAIDDDVFLGGDIAASVTNMSVKKAPAEVRAIWISYLEFERILKNKSENQFRASINTMFGNIKDFGINTAIVHVRPFADALYESEYFPWSHIISGAEGKNPGFDPLGIMVSEAKARGLRIEAWVNPYRIRPEGRNIGLSNSNQAKKWIENEDDSVIRYGGVISYNPASTKAQDLIVNGVVEIVKSYDVDGIHIDDYFYPVTDSAFDKNSYDEYKNNGGGLSLQNWRRANVETLIKKIYDGVKKADGNVLFGISPQSSVYNNYNAHYLDVEKISSTQGYCDYICPQIYFGYDNKTQPYLETLKTWDNMVTAPGVKLYVGLAAYKCGAVDSWAGDTGKNEWVKNEDLLKKMTLNARNAKSYGGVAIYRYDSLFNPDSAVSASVKKEAKNLKSLF